jgi:tRNA-2-methylthio-N6-dimethylallyladenosine synthase
MQYDINKYMNVNEIPVNEIERQYYYMAKIKEYISNKEKELGRKLTCCINTFGCQMNARDSEKLLGILETVGYVNTESEDADFVAYNTCTVRENANLKVYGRLGHLQAKKKHNPHMMIALCGCMMQEATVVEKIKKSYRFVDIIFGTHNIFKLAELIYARLNADNMIIDVWKDTDKIVEDLPIDRKYPFKSGVNIMFGCNNFCTYCIVPYVRGRERSRKAEDIINEIKTLVADGVIEIMLLGQNVNSYGNGLTDHLTFPELLMGIEKIDGLERIRFMTSHPKDLSDELIEVMKNSKKICKQLHLPIQAGSTEILKKMNRRYTKEDYLVLVDKIRTAIPDISLSTDIMIGFPTETEEDFLETMDIVKKVRFDSAFTFIYSKRTGTAAAVMEDQIPEDVVKDRFDRLLNEIHHIAADNSKNYVGKVYDVLVEEENSHIEGYLTGRLQSSAVVHFKAEKDLIGKIVNVLITESKGFYFNGELVK